MAITILLTVGFVWSCCKEPQKPYWKIQDFQLGAKGVDDSGRIETDTLVLNIDLETEFLAYQRTMPFINQCFALSQCPGNGSKGMKDPITEIIVSSDEDFNSFEANSSLNKIVSIYPYSKKLNDWVEA